MRVPSYHTFIFTSFIPKKLYVYVIHSVLSFSFISENRMQCVASFINPFFIQIEHRKYIKPLKWENVLFRGVGEMKLSTVNFYFMAGAHLQTVVTGPCLPSPPPPRPLTIVCKHLGSEESLCWSFGRGMSSHSCSMTDAGCSTVTRRLCHIFCFMVCQLFFLLVKARTRFIRPQNSFPFCPSVFFVPMWLLLCTTQL